MLGDDWKTCEGKFALISSDYTHFDRINRFGIRHYKWPSTNLKMLKTKNTKTDMDECELEDVGQTCAGTCINTIGSFRCSEEDDASSQEDGQDAENEEDDREAAEAIQEAATSSSTQTSTTTSTTSTTPATTTTTTTPTPTTTSTEATTTTSIPTTMEAITTTTTTTESPALIPAEEEDEDEENGEEEEGGEEESEDGEEEEPEDNKQNKIDPITTTTPPPAVIVETKEEEKIPELEETCPEGFQLADRLAEAEDGSACLDVDECATEDQFGCSHLCVNTQGSAHCDCPSGWKMTNDGKTCRGNQFLKSSNQGFSIFQNGRTRFPRC